MSEKIKHYNVWTEEENDILRRMWPTHSIHEVSRLLPRFTPSAIRCHAHTLGLHKDFAAKHAQGQKKVEKRSGGKVIAYEPDGVRIFDNVARAGEYYKIVSSRIYDLIQMGGETMGGISFDWWRGDDE